MKDIIKNSIVLINNIINSEEVNNIDFYIEILKKVSFLYNTCSLGIFLYENMNCETKAAIKNKINIEGYTFKEEYIKDFFENDEKSIKIKTKEDEFLYPNTLLIKLSIKNSVFGFCALSLKDKIDKDIELTFESIASVLSYKIKDYELKEVFKMQLKAMQEAIIQKDEAYEIIKKQHKKLAELNKTKNVFLANISHELRTPLNAIIGFSQALDSKIFGDLNKKQAEYIKDIQVSSLHLLGMINEILDISKLEAHAMKFNPDELNPTIVIEEIIKIIEPLYKNKDINIEFISNFKGLVKADYQKLRQILFNLLSNAIKFTDKNGKIEIIQESKDKDYILKIKDNGIGIEKKYQNKIFKKFVQLNNLYTKNQSSTGLGLTITKELVKLHNGKITLESEINKGTTFIIEFKKAIL